jgi:hypothetical protein
MAVAETEVQFTFVWRGAETLVAGDIEQYVKDGASGRRAIVPLSRGL